MFLSFSIAFLGLGSLVAALYWSALKDDAGRTDDPLHSIDAEFEGINAPFGDATWRFNRSDKAGA